MAGVTELSDLASWSKAGQQRDRLLPWTGQDTGLALSQSSTPDAARTLGHGGRFRRDSRPRSSTEQTAPGPPQPASAPHPPPPPPPALVVGPGQGGLPPALGRETRRPRGRWGPGQGGGGPGAAGAVERSGRRRCCWAVVAPAAGSKLTGNVDSGKHPKLGFPSDSAGAVR